MKRLFFLSIVIAFVLSNFANAQDAADYKSLDDPIPIDPNIKIGKLDNGLKYYIKKNSKPENRMVIRMPFLCGSNLEDDDQKGLAHFIEHMAFNGSKHFHKNELINFLEKTGVRFGADLNAHTWFNETVYKLELPSDDKELVDKGITVFADWGFGLDFAHEEIDRERGVILEEWRLRNGAGARSFLKHLAVAAEGSRYVDRYTIGDTNIILNAPYEAFTRYYGDWYRPDLSAVIVVGDIDVNEIEKLIKEKFSSWKMPKNPREYRKFHVPFHKENKVSIALDPEASSPQINLSFKHKEFEQGTYRAYRGNLVRNLISSLISGKLSELTKKGDPPYQYAAAFDGKMMSFAPAFQIFSALRADQIERGYRTMLTEVFRAYQHGFPQSDIDREKKSMLRMIDKFYDEKDKLESVNLAEEFIRNFMENEAIPGIEVERKLYYKWLPEITNDELVNEIRSLLKDENMVVMYTGPESIQTLSEAQFLDIYKEIRSSQIEAYKDESMDKPLFSKSVKPGTVKGMKKYDKIGVQKLTLSNGINVYLKKTDFKDDEILFSAWSNGGSSLAPDSEYLSSEQAASITNFSGLGDFDNIQLEKALTGQVANASPYINELYEGFRGNASPKDVETMFQMIHLYFSDARFDNDAFDSYLTFQKEQIKNIQRNPMKPLIDTIGNVMSNYDFRSRPMTEEMLQEIDIAKAAKFYKDRFSNAGDFNFIFVGNFDMKTFVPMINKYLGSLPNTGRQESWKDLGVRPPYNALERSVHKGIEYKSNVYLLFNGLYNYNLKNRHLLSSLTKVFNIRLREGLREDKGGTYGAYSRANHKHYPYEGYSIFVSWGCSPERVDELIGDVEKIIKELQTNLPSDEDMTKIKETQRKEYEKDSKTNSFWLNNINMFTINDLDLDQIVEYPKLIEELTKEDIREAAEIYLNTKSMKKFILYPEEK